MQLLGIVLVCLYTAVGANAGLPSLGRTHSVSITRFGGVGDGATLNTKAFKDAVDHLAEYSDKGGGLLFVPPGKWLTGSFYLASNFTLYLDRNAVILGSQDLEDWPLIPPLPSYGRGRDAPGPRYSSLITGNQLSDVVMTGENGTIDGQGAHWWHKFRSKQLKYTRGHLVELMSSNNIVISNLTFLNSPAWTIHPVYCSDVLIQHVTILAPLYSPNTDGIDPDSSSHVRIENCYVSTGDDVIAIKSGWDEYGIAYGKPSEHIIIRHLVGITPTSAVIALGSEMSGGIQTVWAEDIHAINSEAGIRIKTSAGRGGFVRDIHVNGMTMVNMKWAFAMTGFYGQHPDDKYDPNALPLVEGIHFDNIVATNVSSAGQLDGIREAPFRDICLTNVTITMAKPKHQKAPWKCTNVHGSSYSVSPKPCRLLRGPKRHGFCSVSRTSP